MAKTLIMTMTALMVLSVILWMWRVDARSSKRDFSLSVLEKSSSQTQSETQPETPIDLPEDVLLPCVLPLSCDSSLSELVERYYKSYDAGSRSFPVLKKNRSDVVKKLASYNRLKDPKAILPAGMSVSLPRIYIVRDGDSLTKIAGAVYGDVSRIKDIFKANEGRIANRDSLRPGWVLIIPEP